MAKANQKAATTDKSKLMNENFDQLVLVFEDVAEQSEEIMPLLSASMRLSILITKTYKKAFNAGKKYAK